MYSLAAIQTNNYWQNRCIVLFVIIWFSAFTKLRLTQIENWYLFQIIEPRYLACNIRTQFRAGKIFIYVNSN